MFYYILFFLFSLGQIGRISIQNQNINFYIYEIVLLGYFIYLFSKYKFAAFKSKIIKGLYYFPLALAVSLLFSFYNYSIVQNITALLYLIRTSFYFILGIYIHKYFTSKKNNRVVITSGMVLFIISVLITSFIQYFLYPNLRNLIYLGWDPHQFRIFGVFLDTSISAAIYGLVLIYLLVKYNDFLFSKMSRNLLLLAFMILGLLTYSRGFYISILITLIYYLFRNKNIKYIFLLFGVFIISLYIIPKPFGEGVNLLRVYSIESRIYQNREGLKNWYKSPLFGVGYNHLKSVNKIQSVYPEHASSAYPSSFITVLATSGLVGLLFFILALKSLWNYSKMSKYFILFLSVFSLMDNILLHPFILFLLLFLINDS